MERLSQTRKGMIEGLMCVCSGTAIGALVGNLPIKENILTPA